MTKGKKMNKKRKKKLKKPVGALLFVVCAAILTGLVFAATSFLKNEPESENGDEPSNLISNENEENEDETELPISSDDETVYNEKTDLPEEAETITSAEPENQEQNAETTPETPVKVDISETNETKKEEPSVPTYTATDDPAAHIPETADSEWNLILVNPWNKLPEGFEVKLTQLKNGHSVDERAYPDLQQMMDDARAEGLSPIICSSYRTNAKQTTLFTNQVNSYLAKGYEYDDAIAEAGKWVAVPGTSEHQTGLAVDIVATSYQILDEAQEKTAEQKWLMENSYKYGWILRYPSDKSELTGIYYEPWHYRYVGKEVAKYIYENNICFEEYLTLSVGGTSEE